MDAIVNQIKFILQSKEISASEFADIMGVKRANVSHVLSGRNKPSLEFVIKLCEAFNEVDLNSLLLNRDSIEKPDESMFKTKELRLDENVKSTRFENLNKVKEKGIDRIVLFFNDGSFKEYNNNDIT